MSTVLNSAILGGIIWLLYYISNRRKRNIIAHQQGCLPPPNYPHKDPFFGLDYVLGTHFNLPIIARHHSRYGRTFASRNILDTQLNTSDPKNARAIIGGVNEWGVAPLRLPGMELFCGEGIITSDGSAWQHSRGLLKHVFRTHNIVHLPTLELATDELFSHIPADGETVDLQPLFSNLFLDTATQFLLGFNSLSTPGGSSNESIIGDIGSFTNDFHDSMFYCGMRIVLGRLRFLVLRKKMEKTFKSSHDFLDHCISKAFAEKNSGNPQSTEGTSLLRVLVQETDDRIEIRNQMIQNLMAASDTISILLSNTLFLLSRHPKIWKDLRAKILDTLKTDKLTIESLNSVGLLRNVLFEALRLYPVFPLLGRVSLTDTTLPTGGGPSGASPIYVPAGTRADVCFYAIFRDETLFGPDANEFNPSRWETIKPDSWVFLPFGRGPRNCLGREKAMLEACYVIVKIARRFERIESRDERDYQAEAKLTCQNGNGCKVALFEK